MDQTGTNKDMILIECKVTEPQCIQYLSSGLIAIGGKSGVQSVRNNDGSSISVKYNQKPKGQYSQQAPFPGTIYQIVSGRNSYLAVDKTESHCIELFNTCIIGNEKNGGKNWFYCKDGCNFIKHSPEMSMTDILLYPHSQETIPFDIPAEYHSIAYDNTTLTLAILHKNMLKLSRNVPLNRLQKLPTITPAQEEVYYVTYMNNIEFDKAETLPEDTEKGQRLSFSEDGSRLAVVLMKSAYIILMEKAFSTSI